MMPLSSCISSVKSSLVEFYVIMQRSERVNVNA